MVQMNVMIHLKSQGFVVPVPVQNVDGVDYSIFTAEGGGRQIVWIFLY